MDNKQLAILLDNYRVLFQKARTEIEQKLTANQKVSNEEIKDIVKTLTELYDKIDLDIGILRG